MLQNCKNYASFYPSLQATLLSWALRYIYYKSWTIYLLKHQGFSWPDFIPCMNFVSKIFYIIPVRRIYYQIFWIKKLSFCEISMFWTSLDIIKMTKKAIKMALFLHIFILSDFFSKNKRLSLFSKIFLILMKHKKHF